MSNVQVINAHTSAPHRPGARALAKKVDTLPGTSNTHSIAMTSKSASGGGAATDHAMFRSPLKKRPYREPDLQPDSSKRVHLAVDQAALMEHQQQMLIIDNVAQHEAEMQAVNMSDVATTVYDAYIETVQFTFNNTMTMRQSLCEKLACPASVATLDDHMANACWKAYESRFNEAITDVVNFAKRIPGFTALETDDQIILIKGGSFEVSLIRNCQPL